MKIGILIDRLNIGGVEKSAIQEVRALNKLRADATLIVLSRKSVVKLAHKDLLKGVPVIFLDDRFPKLLKFTFKFPGFAFFSFFHISYPLILPFFVKRGEFKYIISHGSYTTLSALSLKITKGIPYSIYFWDPVKYIIRRVYVGRFPSLMISLFSSLGTLIDGLLSTNSDHVFVAANTHDTYLTRFVKKENIVVVPPGTYIGKRAAKKGKHVLMVTTWKKGKNPEYVFEIVEKLPDIKLKMVGGWLDPAMLSNFKEEIKNRGFEDNIELCGAADEEMLAQIYPKALVHLTTNLEKGFGMPVLEAAACGTLSIVAKGSGVCSVFKHGIDTFITEERDTKKIAKYIKKLIENPSIAKKMGNSAYERVKNDFSWKAHVQKLFKNINVF